MKVGPQIKVDSVIDVVEEKMAGLAGRSRLLVGCTHDQTPTFSTPTAPSLVSGRRDAPFSIVSISDDNSTQVKSGQNIQRLM